MITISSDLVNELLDILCPIDENYSNNDYNKQDTELIEKILEN